MRHAFFANPYVVYSERVMRIHHAFLTSSTAFFFRSVADLCLSLSVYGRCYIQQQNLIIIAASLKLPRLNKK